MPRSNAADAALARAAAADAALARAAAAEDEERDEPQRLPDESDYAPAHLEIDRLKAEFGLSEEDVTFQIFREGPAGYRDLTFIRSTAPDEFSYELLQHPPFNGGKFRVYIRNGSGFKRNFGVTVEAPGTLVPPGNADGATAALIAAMSAGFQTLSQQLQHVTQAASSGQAGGMDIKQTIELFTMLQAVANRQPAAPVVDPLDMLGKLLDLKDKLTPAAIPADSDAASSMMVIEGIKMLGNVLTTAKASQAASSVEQSVPMSLPSPVVENPATSPNQPLQAAMPLEPTEMELKIALIKMPLLTMAAAGRNPYPYAEMLLDTFSEEEIETYVNAADWFEQLTTLIPEAKDYKPWFEKLREEVLELLTDPDESDSVGQSNPPT